MTAVWTLEFGCSFSRRRSARDVRASCHCALRAQAWIFSLYSLSRLWAPPAAHERDVGPIICAAVEIFGRGVVEVVTGSGEFWLIAAAWHGQTPNEAGRQQPGATGCHRTAGTSRNRRGSLGQVGTLNLSSVGYSIFRGACQSHRSGSFVQKFNWTALIQTCLGELNTGNSPEPDVLAQILMYGIFRALGCLLPDSC